MELVAAGLFVHSYVLAVIDGTLQDKGTYPSSPGKTGFRQYSHQHPLLLAGALVGIAGTIVAVCAE